MLELGDNPVTHQVHLMRDSSSEFIDLGRSFSLSFHYIYIIYTGQISTFTQVLYLSKEVYLLLLLYYYNILLFC